MTSPEPFGRRFRTALQTRIPVCVGIDPHPELLADWGLSDDPRGLEYFARTVVEALADQVAAVKPQSAFFERHGARGIAALEMITREAREAGALVILDVKRGDIGSTVEAYAQAYLDPSSTLFADAITASPYLGFESLRPLLNLAAATGAGVFVLAYTSNPQARSVQTALLPDGRQVGSMILDCVAAENAGATPLGSVGAVIGATLPRLSYDLQAVNGPVLLPGIGAQGGTPDHVRNLVGSAAANALPAVSRQVLRRGPDRGALWAAVRDGAYEITSGYDAVAHRSEGDS